MKIADYVVTESGFGSDMGMEKFFDIVCRFGELTPSAVVLVTTVRAIKHHGNVEDDPRVDRSQALRAIEVGMANVRRHIGIIKEFGMPAVVAVNRRPGDTNEEVELVKRLALEAGAFGAEANEGFARGGAGAADLAERRGRGVRAAEHVQAALRATTSRSRTRSRRSPSGSTGPPTSTSIPRRRRSSRSSPPTGSATSRSAWPRRTSRSPPTRTMLNAPEHFTLPVRDIRAYTGAGWLVPLCGDITQMPGLGKSPAALNVDIDAEGRTVGLF